MDFYDFRPQVPKGAKRSEGPTGVKSAPPHFARAYHTAPGYLWATRDYCGSLMG